MLPALAAAGASLLGSVTQSGASFSHASKARRHEREMQSRNIQEAFDNRNFQRQMSNTAYERATRDLKNAGLNPMLAYMQGGASTPSGGQGSGSGSAQGQAVNPTEGVVSSALAAKRLSQELKNLKEEEKVKKETQANIKASTNKAKTETEVLQKQMPKNDAIGKGGKMISQGLEAINNSAKAGTESIFQKFQGMFDNVETNSARDKKRYMKSPAHRDYKKNPKNKSRASGSW